MGPVCVENKPAPLHLRVSQFDAAPAGHLGLVEREIHMLGGVPVQVIDPQAAPAIRKGTRREGV